jgi:thiamine-phosphate pyrophosphorylase
MAKTDAPPRIGRLHVLTDPEGPRPVLEVVAAALQAGAPVVQARVKSGSDRERYELTTRIVAACHARDRTCIVDDRVDLALATGADGVHLGDEDLPPDAARRVLGPSALVGVTARTPQGARSAVAAGADYVGVGPAHPSGTKAGLPPCLGPAGIGAVVAAVPAPVIAISGITAERITPLMAAGAHGVAVIGAVSRSEDPEASCRSLLAAVERGAR